MAFATSTIYAEGQKIDNGAIAVRERPHIIDQLSLTAARSWTNNSSNLLTLSVPASNGANLLTIAGTGNTAVSGIIGNGSGTLTKSDTRKLTLPGTNTYAGLTTVGAGKLAEGVSSPLSTGVPLTPVPEPSTWVAGCFALSGLLCWHRKRFARFFRHRP